MIKKKNRQKHKNKTYIFIFDTGFYCDDYRWNLYFNFDKKI